MFLSVMLLLLSGSRLEEVMFGCEFTAIEKMKDEESQYSDEIVVAGLAWCVTLPNFIVVVVVNQL